MPHKAAESRPLFSPDGRSLAFISRRTGNGDIYVLTLAGGDLRRITFDDWEDQLSAWSADGKYLYFSTSSQDISAMADIYRVPAVGGTAVPVSADRYAAEYFAAPAPLGDELALTTKGENWRKWWRRGHSAKDASEIWVRRPGPRRPVYQRLSRGGAKDMWPMWSVDAKRLYFVSDRGGTENLWVMSPSGGPARVLTQFRDGRLLWPTISHDGRQIVFEREFAIWLLDIATGKVGPVPITVPAAPPATVVRGVDVSGKIEELAVSPDGRQIAVLARGEVFLAPRQGGTGTRLTRTAARESMLCWYPQGQRLAYVSERTGNFHLFLYDIGTAVERQLTFSAEGDYSPAWSPDGRHLAFVRGATELVVLDLERNQQRVLAKASIGRPPVRMSRNRVLAWSPDGRWIAFASDGPGTFRNVSVVSIEGGPARQVSQLANIEMGALSWHPDGTSLLFDTGIDGEGQRFARVWLAPTAPRFPAASGPQPPRLTRSGIPESSAAGTVPALPAQPPLEIRTEGIHRRLSLLPLGLPVNYQHTVSSDGRWLAFVGNAAGQSNVYLYSLDETAPAITSRPLTATAGAKLSPQFSPDSQEVFFLEGGRILAVGLGGGAVRPIPVTAEVDVDFDQEKGAMFAQAWLYLQSGFYDSQFHGVNWRATRDRFAPWAEAARSPEELRRIVALMMGELNVSHLVIGDPNFAPPLIGRLGVRLDGDGPDEGGRLRIAEVIGQGPADAARIKAGEWIFAVDGKTLTARTNVDELLERKVGRRVMLTLVTKDGVTREAAVRPVNVATEKQLLYRDWVESRRAYVEQASGGRLGYVHLFNMGGNTVAQMALDLDADAHHREGVVVDIRNNYGGTADGHVLDFLTRKNYQTVQHRNSWTGQQRHIYGQRALGLPTVLVTNTHTISDGECLAEGYRELKAGLVVGEPTAGEVIVTGSTTLLDGTGLSSPAGRTLANDGTEMEGNPRRVDIFVERPIGESNTGQDRQLDAAVRHLLTTLKRHPAQHKAKKPLSRQ